MKLPTKFTIKGYEYLVQYVATQQEVDSTLRDEYLGQVRKHLVRICVDQQSIGIFDTLVHEILHSIFAKNQALYCSLRPDADEYFVDALATEIAHFLVENKLVQLPLKLPPLTKRIVEDSDEHS